MTCLPFFLCAVGCAQLLGIEELEGIPGSDEPPVERWTQTSYGNVTFTGVAARSGTLAVSGWVPDVGLADGVVYGLRSSDFNQGAIAWGPAVIAGSALLYDQATGVTIDAAGDVWVSAHIDEGIGERAYALPYDGSDGTPLTEYSSPSLGTRGYGIVADGSGHVLLAIESHEGSNPETDFETVQVQTAGSVPIWGRTWGNAGQFDYPLAIGVDGMDNVYTVGTHLPTTLPSDPVVAIVCYDVGGNKRWEYPIEPPMTAGSAIDVAGIGPDRVVVVGNVGSPATWLAYVRADGAVTEQLFPGILPIAVDADAEGGAVFLGNEGTAGSPRLVLRRYRPDGAEGWTLRADGILPVDVAVDRVDGAIYVVGLQSGLPWVRKYAPP